MKKILIFISFFVCHLTIWSQNNFSSSKEIEDEKTLEECISLIDNNKIEECIPSLLRLKKIHEENSSFNEELYANIVVLLNFYYYDYLGDIYSSKRLLNEAIKVINEKSNNANTEFTRDIWLRRGSVEFSLKNYSDALAYFHEAQLMFEDANDFGQSYMYLLFNMAAIYMDENYKSDLLSAKIYMDEAISLYEKTFCNIFEIKNEEHLMLLLNYGNLNLGLGKYQLAEKCYKYIIGNNKNSLLSLNAYQFACNNLSVLLMKQGRWEESLELLKNNIDHNNNENKYLILQNIALISLLLQENKQAIENLKLLNEIGYTNIASIFSHFSETERENYWSKYSKEQTLINNLIACGTKDPDAISMALNYTLFSKSFLLKYPQLIDNLIKESGNVSLLNLYTEYLNLKTEYTYKDIEQSLRDSLFIEIRDRENHIINSFENLNELILKNEKKWTDVLSMLNDDEVALEFCYVTDIDRSQTLNPYPEFKHNYGVYILRKDFSSPQLILLDEIDKIEDIFYQNKIDEVFINELYKQEKSNMLYDKIWKNILPYLNGVRNIYYTPTGMLSNLNLELLSDFSGEKINQKFNLYRLSSTAKINEIKSNLKSNYSSSVLYGNIAYNLSLKEMEEESKRYDCFLGESINKELALRSADERGNWGEIPYTKIEIDNIKDILKKEGIKTLVIEGKQANEESFKTLNKISPDIIHIATHGFVFDTPNKVKENKYLSEINIYSNKETYMVWSGLLMAGANNIWNGNLNNTNVEDGILTASEIAKLDLSNTKLVVLSACETAKGKVEPIDGIYGLQRAFKQAGVGTILMSLWKVQDDVTAMLMTNFYSYLFEGKSVRMSLNAAMNDVKKTYPDPYYWSGWVVLD